MYRQSQRGLGRATPAVDEPGQTTLFATEEEVATEDDESELLAADESNDLSATPSSTPDTKQQKKRGGRLTIPDHLERKTIVLEPDADVQEAIAAGLHVEAMKPVITERLDYVPGRYLVKRYERPRYRICDGPLESHRSASLPSAIIEHGQVEDRLLIELEAVS